MNKKLLVFFLLILLITYGCQVNSNPCSLSEEVLSDLQNLDNLINVSEIKERDRQWMKGNFNEPSILDAKNETYRFIWSSSFNGSVVYRIEKIDDQVKAVKKKFINHSDTIGVSYELDFSIEDWDYLTSELESKDYWIYPTSIDSQDLDGESWSLSAYKPIKDKCTLKNFHSVTRWSPIDTTFIEMCKLFYELKER